MALGTGKRPLALVSGFELPVGVIVLLPALTHEDALAEPTEGGHACLGFRHVTDRPAPSLVPDQPADRASLEVRFIVRPENPERHSVVELDRVVLALVAVDAGRHESSHRLALVEELLQARLGIIAGVLVGLVKPEGRPRKVGDDVTNR